MEELSTNQKAFLFRRLNQIKVRGIGFADLNAYSLDLLSVGLLNRNGALKLLRTVMWTLSKVSFKKTNINVQRAVILIPADLHEYRSIGLFDPVSKKLQPGEHEMIALNLFVQRIDLKILLQFIVTMLQSVVEINKATAAAVKIDKTISKFRSLLIFESFLNLLWIRQFEMILASPGVKKVVVEWDRNRFQSLILIAAKNCHLESYTFVHGAIYTPKKFVPLIADYCFTWGEQQNSFFLAAGESPNRLKKAGNPRFTTQLQPNHVLKSQLKLDGANVLLHPSQNFPDLKEEEVIEEIVKGIVDLNSWRLVVKFHPSQTVEKMSFLKHSFPNVIFLEHSVSAEDALSICDVVTLVSSTFSIDALIKGKPVLLYKPFEKTRGIALELIEAGTQFFENADGLRHILQAVDETGVEHVLNTQSQQDFIFNYCTYFGEDSADRIVTFLREGDSDT